MFREPIIVQRHGLARGRKKKIGGVEGIFRNRPRQPAWPFFFLVIRGFRRARLRNLSIGRPVKRFTCPVTFIIIVNVARQRSGSRSLLTCPLHASLKGTTSLRYPMFVHSFDARVSTTKAKGVYFLLFYFASKRYGFRVSLLALLVAIDDVRLIKVIAVILQFVHLCIENDCHFSFLFPSLYSEKFLKIVRVTISMPSLGQPLPASDRSSAPNQPTPEPPRLASPLASPQPLPPSRLSV